MKRSLEDQRSSVKNITTWFHSRSTEAMTISQQADAPGLAMVASKRHAKRRSCISGIHH
ncbi:MAG: hypothetical protein Q8O81_12065 [Giesbergeria sp.]|nr:hypothetical protein [Giesbergeria sp.]